MQIKKTRPEIGVNIGTSSLLLVFVIICLISFATLSVVSANADKRLDEKVSDKSKGYYNACTEANMQLASIDEFLVNAYNNSLSSEDYFAQVGESISFCIDISEYQTLKVDAQFNYPTSDKDTFYTITSWSIETVSIPEIDNSINVINFE